MKTTENETSIINSNMIGEPTEFKIKTTATAFKILSDGLYSNKIGSMIRELLCNAYDAHKAAGTLGTPITVELPTILEPNFRIRDYGTGLSEEDMKRIYTTYFESTKSTNNEFIGGFGLGSKTPLCYNNEQFFVRSYFNGKMFLYNVSIGENGAPILTKWDETDTDEHNGLEIELAVRKEDMEAFKTELVKFNLWAGFNLDINGVPSVSFKYDRIFDTADAYIPYLDSDAEKNTMYENSTFNKVLNNYFGTIVTQQLYAGGYAIRIGKVGYRVSKSVFENNYQLLMDKYLQDVYDEAERIVETKISTERRLEYTRRLFGSPSGGLFSIYENNSFVYDFKVGELDVTASREHVSLTERTLKTLMIKLVGMSVAIAFKQEKLYRATSKTDYRKIIAENVPVLAATETVLGLDIDIKNMPKDVDDVDPPENREIGPCFESFERIAAEYAAVKYHRLRYQSICKMVYKTIARGLLRSGDENEYKAEFYILSVVNNGALTYWDSEPDAVLSRELVLNRRVDILVSTASIDSLVNGDGTNIVSKPRTPVVFVKTKTAKIGRNLVARLKEENENPNRLFTFNAEFVRKPRPKPRDQNKIKMKCFIAFQTKTENGETTVMEVKASNDVVRDAIKEERNVVYIPTWYTWRELLGSIDYLRVSATHFGGMLHAINKNDPLIMFFHQDHRKAFEADYPDLVGGEYLHDFSNGDDKYVKPLWRIAIKAFAFPFDDLFFGAPVRGSKVGTALKYWNKMYDAINTTLDKSGPFLRSFYMRNRPRVVKWGTLLFTMLDSVGISVESIGRLLYFAKRNMINSPIGLRKDDELTLDEKCCKIADRMDLQYIKSELERFCLFDSRAYSDSYSIIPVYQKLVTRLLDNVEKEV